MNSISHATFKHPKAHNRYQSGKGGGNAEKVADAGVTRESGFLYYVDKNGNVSRSPMARGRK